MVIGVTSSNVLRRRSAPRSAGVVLLRSIVAFAVAANARPPGDQGDNALN